MSVPMMQGDGPEPRGVYQVYRTTSDRLGGTLNEIEALGREPMLTQWLGGRDWVVISQPMAMATVEVTDRPVGWVLDQQRRHQRCYEALDSPDVSYGTLPGGVPGELMLVEPEMEWGNIRYGRYDEQRLGHEFTGWVEDVAKTWILFFGPHGAPRLYFPRRDSGGGVIGEPISLQA